MNNFLTLLVAVAAAVSMTGCGKGPAPIAAKSKAFDGAPAAVKQTWDAAVACAATNDYAGASALLAGLRREQLTPAQAQAVEAALTSVMETVYAAVERGDPAAKAALEKMKARTRR